MIFNLTNQVEQSTNTEFVTNSVSFIVSAFRSKFSDFIIFPAIDYQYNIDLLNFYARVKVAI